MSRTLKHYEAQDQRISVDYITDSGQYHAAHWHSDLVIIYLLNGSAEIILDGTKLQLVQGEFIVIDANRIYELLCKESFMQVSVHVDRTFLQDRAGTAKEEGQVAWLYRCSREDLTHELLPPYLEICDLFKELVPLYINEPAGYLLKTESIVLDILYRIVQFFSHPVYKDEVGELSEEQRRVQSFLDFIEEHYAEPLSLQDLSDEFALSREYFSRLFKKSIGISFSDHLSRVRISHFYHDLTSTDEPIMELLDKHGITNYKHFSRKFKAIYGCTPRDIRNLSRIKIAPVP